MKKPSMLTIIGSSGRDSVLMILFQLYGTKAGHFKVICSGGGGRPPQEDSSPHSSYWKKS